MEALKKYTIRFENGLKVVKNATSGQEAYKKAKFEVIGTYISEVWYNGPRTEKIYDVKTGAWEEEGSGYIRAITKITPKQISKKITNAIPSLDYPKDDLYFSLHEIFVEENPPEDKEVRIYGFSDDNGKVIKKFSIKVVVEEIDLPKPIALGAIDINLKHAWNADRVCGKCEKSLFDVIDVNEACNGK